MLTKELTAEELKALTDPIEALENDYLNWYGSPENSESNISLLREAQKEAEKKSQEMTLDEIDDHASTLSGYLSSVNTLLVPPLETYYKTMKAHVGYLIYKKGMAGNIYKDAVEGHEKVTRIFQSYRIAERLAASITHALGYLQSMNYRINSEIKAGIRDRNHSSFQKGGTKGRDEYPE